MALFKSSQDRQSHVFAANVGTLHSARGAMVDLSHKSGLKSYACLGRHCCSDVENGMAHAVTFD